MSELDKWFPRPEKEPEPQPKPEHGVIQGVKRQRPKHYGRRWYSKIHKKHKGEEGNDGNDTSTNP